MSESTSFNKSDTLSTSLSDSGWSSNSQIELSNNIEFEQVRLAISHPKKKAGRRIFKETRHPIYRGVRRRNNNKWVCELREPNKKTRIWLGTYPNPEMAARAHDVAALALRGKSACLNFADSAWRLPVPTTNEAKEIRRVAAEAAEAFRVVPELVEEAASASCRSNAIYDVIKEDKMDYMYEESIFDMPMPRLLGEMAQGLLISPPHLEYIDDLNDWGSDHTNTFSLWSFSI
ncbi:hypothetical protein ACFE04_013794 [Oxalis oulophora]